MPVVSYPLWPETFELLKQERSDDPDHVLLTREGKLLRTEYIDGGKYKKTDAVRLAIRRLSKKTEIESTFKACKKAMYAETLFCLIFGFESAFRI
ncbi:MAG: hypothetical protein CME32_13135 [Gimesia sp.]|nr:hypothetical protein [Gimesia sp.]